MLQAPTTYLSHYEGMQPICTSLGLPLPCILLLPISHASSYEFAFLLPSW